MKKTIKRIIIGVTVAIIAASCFSGCLIYNPKTSDDSGSGSSVVKPDVNQPGLPVNVVYVDKDQMAEHFNEDLSMTVSRINRSVVTVVATYSDGKGGSVKKSESGVVTGFSSDNTEEFSYIVISHHLIVGATSVSVYARGSETALAPRLIGTDPQTDLCVLRVDKKLDPAFICDLPEAEEGGEYSFVGKSVLTVADALGKNVNVVSRGIISAENYFYSVGEGVYESYYLTDAFVGEGSSGGGLFSENGGVLLGIINGKIGASEGWNGFVLPVSTAIKVCSEIINNEEHCVSGRYKLGFAVENVSTSWGLPEDVKFTEVSQDGSFYAKGNGIKVGDVVKSFKIDDGEDIKVTLASDFYDWFYVKLAGQLKVGTNVSLEIERNGTRAVVSFKILQYNYFSE